MSEKCLLLLDTKKVTRKCVKVVKAKRYKLQWSACARPREEMIATLFKAVFSCFLARLSMRRDFLGEVLHRNAPCCLLNRPSLRNKAPLFRKKTPTFFEKSPSFSRKSPSFSRKSPTFLRKSPSFFQSSPTC